MYLAYIFISISYNACNIICRGILLLCPSFECNICFAYLSSLINVCCIHACSSEWINCFGYSRDIFLARFSSWHKTNRIKQSAGHFVCRKYSGDPFIVVMLYHLVTVSYLACVWTGSLLKQCHYQRLFCILTLIFVVNKLTFYVEMQLTCLQIGTHHFKINMHA